MVSIISKKQDKKAIRHLFERFQRSPFLGIGCMLASFPPKKREVDVDRQIQKYFIRQFVSKEAMF